MLNFRFNFIIAAILVALCLHNDTVEGKSKVCVIGAGVSGLNAVRHLARYPALFEIRAFEQADVIGGTWVYTDEVDSNPYNVTVHSSIYKSFKSSLPGKLMSYPDFRYDERTGNSILSREQVVDYLERYAKLHQLTKHFQFRKKVENVSENDDKTFTTLVRNNKNGEQEKYICDSVIVCNGHFAQPYVPRIPGIKTFTGTVLHSHSYREPESFRGKSVIILGGSFCGIDMTKELSTYAERIYLSHNKAKKRGKKPPRVTEVVGIESVSGNVFKLHDRSSVKADVLIFCTGYNFSFPFLDENVGIKNDGKYVSPLYKHIIDINNPKLAFIGIPLSVLSFPLIDTQVQYYLAVLKEQIKLPSKSEMLRNSALKKSKRHAHQLMFEQFDYNNQLASLGGFQPLPTYYRTEYFKWLKERENNEWGI